MAAQHLLLSFIEGTTKIGHNLLYFNDLMLLHILLKARKTILMYQRLFLSDAVFLL